MTRQLLHHKIMTPIGEMDVLATENGICLLEFYDRKELEDEIGLLEKHFKIKKSNGVNNWIDRLEEELNSYFVGELTEFSINTILIGTAFQKKVWQSLMQIPFGKTHTYKTQSEIIGDCKAIRAVASANGKNKIAILVPCHRIIGSNGELTGYSGGLERKRFLLNMERKGTGPKDLFDS